MYIKNSQGKTFFLLLRPVMCVYSLLEAFGAQMWVNFAWIRQESVTGKQTRSHSLKM